MVGIAGALCMDQTPEKLGDTGLGRPAFGVGRVGPVEGGRVEGGKFQQGLPVRGKLGQQGERLRVAANIGDAHAVVPHDVAEIAIDEPFGERDPEETKPGG